MSETATLFAILDWDRAFENSKSRQVERCSFFCAPNHFDGKRIRHMARQERSLALYGAFHLIAAVASRCPNRGVLMDDDGPIGPMELHLKTDFGSEAEFAWALEVLSQRGGPLTQYIIGRSETGEWILPATVAHLLRAADQRSKHKKGSAAVGRQGVLNGAASGNGMNGHRFQL